MKTLIVTLCVLVCANMCNAQKSPQSLYQAVTQPQHLGQQPGEKPVPDDWLNEATTKLQASTYQVRQTPKESFILNAKQHFVAEISSSHFKLRSSDENNAWEAGFKVAAIGGHPQEMISSKVSGNYSSFENKFSRVEYVNDPSGLRQNFIIFRKPAGDKLLSVALDVAGTLTPVMQHNNTLTLLDQSGKVVLYYDALKVWDANHKILDAKMNLNGDRLVIEVNDKNAVYPVTIDPLTHSPEWVISADGVLPALLTNLQLQVDALIGYSVTGLGDVNGDGYDDVAIGAPGAVDVIAGPSTVVGAGAVFIYFGSATGLPTSPSRTLRATTPVANALFGFSVAGGNVAGDSKNDVIIGAPGESYSTGVSGLPVTATVTAGKVYVYRGQDLASGNVTASSSVFLSGSLYFSNGVAELLLSNVSVNALFGFSVATAGDMNSDGLDEIVVGAPGYAGVGLLDVRSGAAFVYYSGSNLGSNTAVHLKPPSLTQFPILGDITGLLFGFSVDGAGDYNQDGKQDIIVGAPGGLSIDPTNLVGGSAYIFKGNASNTGINTTIQAQLSASATLLGPVANLFGYKVKGLRNAAGSRTGKVMVGAPVGNVLNNVLNGLRLKTGNVYVFGQNAAGGNHLPAQSLTSPRGNNLLSILGAQNLNLSVLFGAAMDNMKDVNCDGIADIIVGEPLSTGVGLINANAVGGAAYIFLGKADGTFSTTPFWALENSVSFNLGINAASLIGYSVAGAGNIYGSSRGVRALVGAPGKALDFSPGLLNLGNTIGTLFSFTGGGNGLGKAYSFAFDCDRITVFPDVNVTKVNLTVPGNLNTNDVVPALTTYSNAVPSTENPSTATLTLNPDGSYNFTAAVVGVYRYNVDVCSPGRGCLTSMVTICVKDDALRQPPVAHTDLASTMINQPVTIPTLANDAPGTVGHLVVKSSVSITQSPANGTATVNSLTGDITYTPAPNFTGNDTLYYSISDNVEPNAATSMAMQIISVEAIGRTNLTLAADDYVHISANTVASGNVLTNDKDPEGNTQTVTAQNVTVAGKGVFLLNTDGTYTFTPENNFTGCVSFPYRVCDDAPVSACAGGTVYILVSLVVNPDLTPTTRINNGTFIESQNSTRNFVLEINEIFGRITEAASVPIKVKVNKSDNFNYSFDPAATTANVPGTIAVDNTKWDLIQNNSAAMIFQLKPGFEITGNNTLRIYIQMQVYTGAAEGTENQTVSVFNGSGVEVNYLNNSIARILSIIH